MCRPVNQCKIGTLLSADQKCSAHGLSAVDQSSRRSRPEGLSLACCTPSAAVGLGPQSAPGCRPDRRSSVLGSHHIPGTCRPCPTSCPQTGPGIEQIQSWFLSIYTPTYCPKLEDEPPLSSCINANFCVYITHKNLAVCKIMEAMRTAYAKSRTRSQHVSSYTWGKKSWNIGTLPTAPTPPPYFPTHPTPTPHITNTVQYNNMSLGCNMNLTLKIIPHHKSRMTYCTTTAII